jgi:hypothetical protein
VQRAKRLRHKTKNWALHAKAEEKVVNYRDFLERDRVGHEACVQKRIDETCIQCDKQKNGFLQETLLAQRAKRLRHKTKNWALHAKAEEKVVNYRDIAICIQCDKQKNGFLQEHLKRTQEISYRDIPIVHHLLRFCTHASWPTRSLSKKSEDGMAAWEHCRLLLLFVVES